MTISIDTSDTLGDVVIRISHAELARLTLAMFEQRRGENLKLTTDEPQPFAAAIVERMGEVDDDTGFTAIEGFLASLGCDYLIQDTDLPDRVEAHLDAVAAKVSNVVPIRPEPYDDETTEELVTAFLDEICAEEAA